MIRAVVVPVKGFFAECNGSLDRSAIFGTYSYRCQVFVKMVHGGYDRCNVWRATTRKKEHCILENL
jgi:hypothetical protein